MSRIISSSKGFNKAQKEFLKAHRGQEVTQICAAFKRKFGPEPDPVAVKRYLKSLERELEFA